jgi:hypothetical protein
MYSENVIQEFIKEKVCQGDETLYKYYQEMNIKKFRKRLSTTFGKEADDNIKVAVQTYITDATRDVILRIVRILTKFMVRYGDLIISGGEAINMYLDHENRIVTTDIDTKFTPVIKGVAPLSTKMFGYIQIAKLNMWDKLGKIVVEFNKLVVQRIQKLVVKSSLGKLLGLKIVDHLKRRYTLIKKNKELGTLIDIELFAIDLGVKYYIPSEKKISKQNIGGLLDIAYMKPLEFGFEATYSKSKGGVFIRNPVTSRLTRDDKLLVASEKFLIEDIYALQKYNLRPTKKEKDRKRLYIFAKYILNVKNVSSKDSIETIFRKSISKIPHNPVVKVLRPRMTVQNLNNTLRINPYKYERYTTKPSKLKVYQQFFGGLKGSNGLRLPGYAQTFSNYRFNIHKGEWVKNNNPQYIHNEATYRPTVSENFSHVRLQETLYGYNPARDMWMPPELVKKAAMIPLVGLKIKLAQ